ncbi:MAG TPA: urate oxidase [Bryobacteraceae bacterium]|nr:urate oxidase [Bryobacteraceae bacterium]
MAKLEFDTYGKTKIRLTQVRRYRRGHDIHEISVNILFEGDFEAAFSEGDNSAVLPTDTMKNTVYVVAHETRWTSIDELARALSRHFLNRLEHLEKVIIEIEEVPWERIGDHGTAFVQSGSERRYAKLTATRLNETFIAGITGLQILKTADSAFAGFLKDEFTTLPETHDRLLGTVLEADWTYAADAITDEFAFNEGHEEIRRILLDTFAYHQSQSVQQTLFAMGQAVLDQVDTVLDIHLVMPNKHCLLVDLERFGLDNPNEVFVPTDEPSGYIEARMTR